MRSYISFIFHPCLTSTRPLSSLQRYFVNRNNTSCNAFIFVHLQCDANLKPVEHCTHYNIIQFDHSRSVSNSNTKIQVCFMKIMNIPGTCIYVYYFEAICISLLFFCKFIRGLLHSRAISLKFIHSRYVVINVMADHNNEQ
jgi:hypothetical protein